MEYYDRKIKINSFLTASVITEGSICSISTVFVKIPMVSVLVMALLLLLTVSFNKKNLIITRKSVISFICFLFLLGISLFLNGVDEPGERLVYFLTFGTTAMFVVGAKQNTGLVLKYLLLIIAVDLIVYFLFKRDAFLSSTEFWSLQMGIAYGYVPAIVASIIFLVNRSVFEKQKILGHHWIYQTIFFILISSSYVVFIDCGTRGAFVVVFVAILFIILRKMTRRFRLVTLLGGVVLLFWLYQNSETIIGNSLDNFSDSEVKALVKLSQRSEMGDASNGRDDHYHMAFGMIKESPIVGYGVGYFENAAHGSYVHQFFLEVLLECGIVGLIIFLIPIIKYIRRVHSETDDIEYLYGLFILTCCFLPLMFTASFWLFPPFWYGFFYAINNGNIKKTQVRYNLPQRI